jgi:hypothetical protein
MAPGIKARAGWISAWLLVVMLAAGLGCNRQEQRGSDTARGTQAASTAPVTPSMPSPAPPQAAAPPSASVVATTPAANPAQPPRPKPVSAKAGGADAAPSVPPNVPPEALAKCLAAKGVTMYGDFRCPHCAQQKALFGESFKLVPYVECGTPGKPMTLPNQAQACRDLGITKYPTWIFPDGERVANPQPLNALAEKAGCKVR